MPVPQFDLLTLEDFDGPFSVLSNIVDRVVHLKLLAIRTGTREFHSHLNRLTNSERLGLKLEIHSKISGWIET